MFCSHHESTAFPFHVKYITFPSKILSGEGRGVCKFNSVGLHVCKHTPVGRANESRMIHPPPTLGSILIIVIFIVWEEPKTASSATSYITTFCRTPHIHTVQAVITTDNHTQYAQITHKNKQTPACIYLLVLYLPNYRYC